MQMTCHARWHACRGCAPHGQACGAGACSAIRQSALRWLPGCDLRSAPGPHLDASGVAGVRSNRHKARGARDPPASGAGNQVAAWRARKGETRACKRTRVQNSKRPSPHRVACMVTVRLLLRCSRICGLLCASTMVRCGPPGSRHRSVGAASDICGDQLANKPYKHAYAPLGSDLALLKIKAPCTARQALRVTTHSIMRGV